MIELSLDERAAFLRTACGDDDAMRKSVEALVAMHESGPHFLDRPCAEACRLAALLNEIARTEYGTKERPPSSANFAMGSNSYSASTARGMTSKKK